MLIAGIAGSIWYRQRAKEEAARQQALALHSQVRTLETELAETRAHKEEAPAIPIAPPRATPATATADAPIIPAATKGAPNPAMLNDPETRALMQKQQKQALARMADKLINKDFARDWNLSPDQVKQAKELVSEKASAGKDLLTAMMFDGLDDDALAERGRETKQRVEQSDAALRGLLGDDGFKALTELQHSIEDHGRAKRIREEIATSGQPLTEPQHEAFIAAMSAERQAFSFRVNYDDPSKVDPEHIRDHFSEANLQMYFEDMLQLNARIAERAALFLAPEQLAQLKTAQNNHLEQSRLTVKMTTELFNKRRTN